MVLSLMQTKFLRLRILNLIACLVVMTYHIPLAVWPTVALNGVLALVNAVYLVRLLRPAPPASDASHLGVPRNPTTP